jgi:hypothetical protein
MFSRPAGGNAYLVNGMVHRIKNLEEVAMVVDPGHGLTG